VDAAANLWLRLEGTDPRAAAVVTGSHMDTQPNGGRFDGIYGVIAGLEALTALQQSGTKPRRPVEVVAWTNEEGGRFSPGCMGSMAWSGFRRIEEFADVVDPDGVRFADALAGHLAAETDLPLRPLGSQPHAYVEAHIEQGPRLEAEGLDIGVVTGIQGSRWFTVTLTGETAHAGTTPLALRRDAVQDMVRAIKALNALMHDPMDVLRFTVGRVVVEPNTSNSVADKASFTIDFRHPNKDVLLTRGNAVAGVVQAAVRNAGVTVQETFHALPVEFSPLVIEAVERATIEQNCRQMRLPSGAFHDAQFVVPVCPTGMIFVPCRRGISHNPAEYSEPSQLAVGTRVLTQTLVELADS
ncbi:MAG: M20 family metallo-hydrolase, partial [Acetobacteraceae bacterium]